MIFDGRGGGLRRFSAGGGLGTGPPPEAAGLRHEIAAIGRNNDAMSGRGLGEVRCAKVLRRAGAAAELPIVAVAALCVALAVVFGTLVQPPAHAQMRLMTPHELGSAVSLLPAPGAPDAYIEETTPSEHSSAPPFAQAAPDVPAGRVALMVAARFGPKAPLIGGGLIWRVYDANPDANGMFRLVKEDKAAMPTFVLPPGTYVVHAAFGLASAARAVRLSKQTVHEVFDIPAGGLRLQGRVNDVPIPTAQISFDIYPGSQFDTAARRPVAQNVLTGDVVLLPAGTYYVVSNYGDVNSVVRSDVQVHAAKLTDVVVTHRAAVITLKLVDQNGGEALANTQWTVLTPDGDVVNESIGAFPRLVLAEGDYHLIARNEGKTYQRDLKVINGVDREVELLAK